MSSKGSCFGSLVPWVVVLRGGRPFKKLSQAGGAYVIGHAFEGIKVFLMVALVSSRENIVIKV
jgi:hypothetical protein